MDWVRSQGFDCTQVPAHPLETAIESERMRRRAPVASPQDAAAAKTVVREMADVPPAQDDVVQLVCTRALRFKPGGTPA
jgi:hypothetical protein